MNFFFKNRSCLHIKINTENKPGITGPLREGTDSVRDVHLAPTTAAPFPAVPSEH